MNTFTRSLAEFCRAHPGDEKWLLAPTIRVGHQWIDSVAAAGQPVLNLHALTLRSAAIRLALPAPGQPALKILRSLDALPLCAGLFHECAGDGEGYLLSLRPTLSLIRRLARLLDELRLSGLKPDELAGGSLEHRLKAGELARLLDGYEKFLGREKIIDYPGLLRLAAAAASVPGRKLPWLLLPDRTELSFLERELLGAFPDGRVVTLEIDRLENGYGWEHEPGEDIRFPPTPEPGVEIVRAVGCANEIRATLRRVLSSGWPLEQVELIHTSRETYVPLIYEIMLAALPDGAELPVTFADGVPSRLTRPGRALDCWLRWIGSGFGQAELVEMVAGGLLALPEEGGEKLPGSYLAAVLGRLPVGSGRERWQEILDREIRRAESRDQPGSEYDDESQRRSNPRELTALRLLRALVAGLLEITPESSSDSKALAAGARSLLENHAAYVNELDTYSRRALLDRLDGLNRWLKVHGCDGFDTAAYLAELAGNVQVLGNAPQPGKLHVSGIATGGHTGRPVTVVVGLDDTRWPPSDSQNPLLLDGERDSLSKDLTTAAGRQERAIKEFGLLLCRLRGKVILSFSSSDPLDERELFPSPLLLPVYRKLSGQAAARQKQMLAALDSPASFAPDTPGNICREADWWLASMLALPEEQSSLLLERNFPHLARGESARRMRLSDTFGEFDGLLAEAGPELDPFSPEGPVLSASGLQTLGVCPRRYFYRYVLGLEEPRETPPPSEWLDAAQAGQMLHTVLHRFLARLLEKNQLPENTTEQHEMISGIADSTLAEFRESVPVPGEAAYLARRAWLLQACRTFLVQEAEYCRTHHPRWLEASIGLPGGAGDEIGCEQPVALSVPGGEIRVRGRVDRIDKLNEGESYTVTDYKSGGSSHYDLAKPFDGGRRVQHALYLALVRQRLDSIATYSEAVGFRYFFPAGSERGESRQWSADELAQGPELIGLLCRVSRDGAFAATENTDDCKYCAFKQLCGDLDSQAEAGARKRENPANQSLQTVVRVREHA